MEGNHDDKECEKYCKEYERRFDQEIPDCQFKGNKFKIQNLIRKVHIDNLSEEELEAEKEWEFRKHFALMESLFAQLLEEEEELMKSMEEDLSCALKYLLVQRKILKNWTID